MQDQIVRREKKKIVFCQSSKLGEESSSLEDQIFKVLALGLVGLL